MYADPLAEHADALAFKDGRIFERYSCPQVVAGVAVGRVWSVREVTQRTLTQAALRKADERYRSVVANMLEGVVVRDADCLIVDCNPSAERLTGRTLDQMRGHASMFAGLNVSVIHESGNPVQVEERHALRALETGRLQANVVLGYCKPGGEVLWLSSTSQPLFREGEAKPTGVFTTFIDITARKRAEEERDSLEGQLRESQKMEAMGTLAGGIAHDFNNILGAILGNVALARDDVGPGHAAQVSLDEIHKAGNRAKQLVQQILSFSRKQPQHFVDQPLRRVIEDTLGLIRATVPAGIEIEVRMDDALVGVHADGTQIGQVLMNLCTNAWHAVASRMGARGAGGVGTAKGQAEDGRTAGRITVVLDRLEVDERQAKRFGKIGFGGMVPGRYARITVSDNGVGMDEATQEHIFEPFYTTKPFGEGTGLGLAVVHGIIKAHHGGITVTSKAGEGAAFEVVLPEIVLAEGAQGARGNQGQAVSRPTGNAAGEGAPQGSASSATAVQSAPLLPLAASAPAAPAALGATGAAAASEGGKQSGDQGQADVAARSNLVGKEEAKPQHIMYVDDEAAMVFLVTRMLRKRGYQVSAYEQPAKALEAVRATPGEYDVVVTDFNMPGMSGLDVAREVLKSRPEMPMVIASGYITEELRSGAAALGVRHLIYKPNTVEELCQAIEKVLAAGA